MQKYSVSLVHKISPNSNDKLDPVWLSDNVFSNKLTLARALRQKGVLCPGQRIRGFRVEGAEIVIFPGGRTIWHCIILKKDI